VRQIVVHGARRGLYYPPLLRNESIVGFGLGGTGVPPVVLRVSRKTGEGEQSFIVHLST